MIMYVLRYGRLGVFLRNEGTAHPLRRFYRICHAMSSRKIGFLTQKVIFLQSRNRLIYEVGMARDFWGFTIFDLRFTKG